MQLTSLITAAGLAASTANAFLLPFPESSESDIINTLPVTIETDTKASLPATAEVQKVTVPCPGCNVRVGHRKSDDGSVRIKNDISSHLELDFSILHAPDHDRLMLNGFELYPKSDPMRFTLGAKVVPDHRKGHESAGHRSKKNRKNKNHENRKHGERPLSPLGFGLRAGTVAKSQGDNMEMVQVVLQIIEVDNVFIDGIPPVDLKLIKTPEGALMIGDIETTKATLTSGKDECTTFVCKWKAILAQQFGRLRAGKNCAGKNSPAHGGHVVVDLDGSAQRHPGHRVMRHGHRASWVHLLKNIVSHIVLPIAIGIAAGILASVIGMVVGTAIVYLWRTFVRPAGTQRHHHRHGPSTDKVVLNEPAASDEKTGLMAQEEEEEDTDTPPAYVEEGLAEELTKPNNEA